MLRTWRIGLPVTLLLLIIGTLLACPQVGQAQRAIPPFVSQTVPMDSAREFTPHVPPRAITYQRSSVILGFVAIFWGLLIYGILLHTGIAAKIRNRSLAWTHTEHAKYQTAPPFLATVLFYFCYSILVTLWSLPAAIAELALEQHFGFSHQTTWGFVRDLGTTLAFTQVGGILWWAALKLYVRSPRTWWVWLWLALSPLLLFTFIVQPIIVAPAYNRFTPLASGKLRKDILALAIRAGISRAQVLVSDTSRRTSHVNAYVSGIGPTTRIVINDTALSTLPEDQILAMVGHEMGHYVEGHVWILCLSSMLGAGVFLKLASLWLPWLVTRNGKRWNVHSLTDLAALPLIMLVLRLFLLVQYPVANAESRYLEHRADVFGLRLTGLNIPMAHLFVGFAERDYSDPDPPALLQFWFGTHPTLKSRIAFARSFKR